MGRFSVNANLKGVKAAETCLFTSTLAEACEKGRGSVATGRFNRPGFSVIIVISE